jgi:hypothetical protein
MAVRDRVRRAIDGPTGDAEKLLNELQHASSDEKLIILINGWCRGLSGALEELAISIDDLAGSRDEPSQSIRAADQPDEGDDREATTGEVLPRSTEVVDDEQQLAERATQSRRETAALKEESSELTGRESSES